MKTTDNEMSPSTPDTMTEEEAMKIWRRRKQKREEDFFSRKQPIQGEQNQSQGYVDEFQAPLGELPIHFWGEQQLRKEGYQSHRPMGESQPPLGELASRHRQQHRRSRSPSISVGSGISSEGRHSYTSRHAAAAQNSTFPMHKRVPNMDHQQLADMNRSWMPAASVAQISINAEHNHVSSVASQQSIDSSRSRMADKPVPNNTRVLQLIELQREQERRFCGDERIRQELMATTRAKEDQHQYLFIESRQRRIAVEQQYGEQQYDGPAHAGHFSVGESPLDGNPTFNLRHHGDALTAQVREYERLAQAHRDKNRQEQNQSKLIAIVTATANEDRSSSPSDKSETMWEEKKMAACYPTRHVSKYGDFDDDSES